MKTVYKLVKEISSLHPIPPVANQILSLANDPDSAISDLVELISFDPAITANLLKVCNSAYLGMAMPVTSIQQAVALLGMKRIIELVLMNCLSPNLLKIQKGYQLEKGELWKNSVATALVSKSIAQTREIDDVFFIYTAALLKDIGKVVIDSLVGKSCQKIRRLVMKKGYTFDEAEKKIIGIDHAALGGIIADLWKFDSRLTFIIKNHHMTQEGARLDQDTSIVYLADIVSMMVGSGIGVDGLAYKFYEEIFTEMSVTEFELQNLLVEYHTHYKKADTLLTIQ
ncbi:MAG: HDOD domain-containing protein [Desulfobacteraceae bacterium]|nr:HDOD domain-containing protein [Desulfobacteraceae bacterium]